jgi:L-histidine N-alpha-methyltransferase
MADMITAVSDRFKLIVVPRRTGVPSFADEVTAGLTASPKRLSSKYLYDDVGSALFDAITRLPEYYLTRAETEILAQWGWQIVRLLDGPVDFVELGSGSAAKTRLLIEEALRVQGELRYSPIDISTQALRDSSLALVRAHDCLTIQAYAGDYFDVLQSQALQFRRRVLAMFMGSNIGNYEPQEGRTLLELLSAALRPGDGLLLGVDLKKDAATLERAYDDPAGVTAAFNRNLLSRINRELGGDLDPAKFRHIAKYDTQRGSVDSFLEAGERMTPHLQRTGLRLAIEQGERIQTEASYKYSDGEIAGLAAAAGFRAAAVWHDGDHRFSVHLLVRR